MICRATTMGTQALKKNHTAAVRNLLMPNYNLTAIEAMESSLGVTMIRISRPPVGMHHEQSGPEESEHKAH